MASRTPRNTRTLIVILCLAALTVAPLLAALPAASAGSAGTTTTSTPEVQTVAGGCSPSSAPLIQYNTTSNSYGLLNTSSGGIEAIRGYLSRPSSCESQYYKIELSKGKVLDARVITRNWITIPWGGGTRISPDLEVFLYTATPSAKSLIDWNVARYAYLDMQDVNILTPVGGGVPNTYYINVTSWLGAGEYDLEVRVIDPTDIPSTGGDFAGTLSAEYRNNAQPDTAWFRVAGTHDSNSQVFTEISGYMQMTNWNTGDPTAIDAIIRIFTEDLGYTPDNPIGKPIEKSEAPNRRVEPISVLAPYTGFYYIMIRLQNTSSAASFQVGYNLRINITDVARFPAGGLFNVHKERDYDDTDWFWFNMSKGTPTTRADRALFNLSEGSDDPLKPVNLNLWLFGYRDFFRPNGISLDFDILNSSFEGDAPYNLTLNPEPRYEEVAATASYTGIYFVEVEDFNNTGNYSLSLAWDTSPGRSSSDNNNEPSQAAAISWGLYPGLTINQSEDHTDFYRITAQAGETIEVTYQMPSRDSQDGKHHNETLGLVWLGIYQPGMQLLNWSWNYWWDFQNNQPTDHIENTTTVRATVAADGDYIIEVTAMQDGFIGGYTLPGTTPPRTIQVFWHMDWNLQTKYTMWVSRLPTYNAQWEVPVVSAPLPALTLNEDEPSVGVYNLSNYFSDPDLIQGDRLNFSFSFSGIHNMTISEVNGLISIIPDGNWSGTNTVLVRATDLQRSYAQQYWNITVLPVNDVPYLVTGQPIRFTEDSGVQVYALSNYIRDVDGDVLTITQFFDPNVTVSTTPTTLRITTAPDFQTTTLGSDYPVFVIVFDGTTTVRLQVLLNVTNLVDAPRRLLTPVNVTCDEDSNCAAVDLNTVFVDPDDPLHQQQLNFLVSGNGPISFTLFNGTLILIPPSDISGAWTIQIVAEKILPGLPPQHYPSEIADLNLVVREVNDPPRITNWSPPTRDVTVAEGSSPKTFSIDAFDPEHLQPKFRWYLDGASLETTLPSFAFIALYSMAHPGANTTFELKVLADDGAGGVVERLWMVTVVDTPRSPDVSIASPLEGNRGYTVGQPVSFFASAYDPDGDALTFTWTDSSGAQILTSATGTYTWSAEGTRRLTLTVSDGVSSVSHTVNVTVSNPPATKGFLPGFELPLTLSALAVVAVAASVTRRRRHA